MFISADALVAHAVGDYLLQSDWMATEKTRRSAAAAAHVVTYTLPFLFLTRSVPALTFVAATHFAIDRWRLARYVVWAKNFLAPVRRVEKLPRFDDGTTPMVWQSDGSPWWRCKSTGYDKDRPAFLAVWLLIIADNILHVLCNGLALHWWAQ